MSRASYSSGAPDDRQTIVCLHCSRAQEVGRRAMTVTCRFCHKPLRLEDIRFTAYEARRTIETCGIITVEQKGTVFADRLHCGGMVVRGKIKGNIISRGTVLVGPEAEIKGDITAPAIAIGAGAVLEGKYQIGSRE
jgi:hypothetical protein